MWRISGSRTIPDDCISGEGETLRANGIELRCGHSRGVCAEREPPRPTGDAASGESAARSCSLLSDGDRLVHGELPRCPGALKLDAGRCNGLLDTRQESVERRTRFPEVDHAPSSFDRPRSVKDRGSSAATGVSRATGPSWRSSPTSTRRGISSSTAPALSSPQTSYSPGPTARSTRRRERRSTPADTRW